MNGPAHAMLGRGSSDQGMFKGESNTTILIIQRNPLILQSRAAETPVNDNGSTASGVSAKRVLKDEEMEEDREMICF